MTRITSPGCGGNKTSLRAGRAACCLGPPRGVSRSGWRPPSLPAVVVRRRLAPSLPADVRARHAGPSALRRATSCSRSDRAVDEPQPIRAPWCVLVGEALGTIAPMHKRSHLALTCALAVFVLTGCQSKKEALQLACDSPNHVDNTLPPDARGQALAAYVEKNVENSEVLGLLGSAEVRTVKAVKLREMAAGEGLTSCDLADLWATPLRGRLPSVPMRPRSSSASSGSAPLPPSSGFVVPHRFEVFGALSREEVKKVVSARSPAIRTCYEAGLRRNAKLAGRIVLRFMIGPDGKVKTADDVAHTMPDAEVVQCVTDVVRALVFPKPEKGEVIVTYPIVLKLGGS